MSRNENRPKDDDTGPAAPERAEAARRPHSDRGVWTRVSDETIEKFLADIRESIRKEGTPRPERAPRRSLEGRCFGTAFNSSPQYRRAIQRRMQAAHAAKTEPEPSQEHEENDDA